MADPITFDPPAQSRTPHAEGQFPVLCVDLIDLGERLKQFPGSPDKISRECVLSYVTGERRDDGKPFILNKRFTVSLDEKANLRKWMEAWRGKKYTEAELPNRDTGNPGPDLTQMVGKGGYGNIGHSERKGKVYADITTIMPLPKGMPGVDPALAREYTRPDFWAEEKQRFAAEVKQFRESKNVLGPPKSVTDALDLEKFESSDDLPFK